MSPLTHKWPVCLLCAALWGCWRVVYRAGPWHRQYRQMLRAPSNKGTPQMVEDKEEGKRNLHYLKKKLVGIGQFVCVLTLVCVLNVAPWRQLTIIGGGQVCVGRVWKSQVWNMRNPKSKKEHLAMYWRWQQPTVVASLTVWKQIKKTSSLHAVCREGMSQ